jgi:outer membrane protein
LYKLLDRSLPVLLACVLLFSGRWVLANDLLGLYRSAMNDNPTLKARRFGIERARGEADQADSRLYPQASIQSSVSRNDYNDRFGDQRYSGRRNVLQARQAIIDLPSYYRSDSARFVIQQAEQEAANARAALFSQIADHYLTALQADDELMQLQSEKEAAQKQVERLRSMREREMAKVTDLTEAISYLQQVNTREIDAINKGEAARVRLRELSGKDPGILAMLARTTFPSVPETADYWVAAARESNPAIMARREALQASRRAADAARAEHYPQLSLLMQYTQSNLTYDNLSQRSYNVGSASLELRIPIYEGGRTSAAEASALAQQAIDQEQLESLLREVERDTRVAYASAQANRARIDSTNAEVDALTQTVRAQERGYELGAATVINVLDARRRLLRARVDQSKARYDYLRDLIGLTARSGKLSEAEVTEFNRWLGPRVD